MPRFARITVPATLVAIGLFAGLVLTSCDLASAGSTVVLDAGATIPPIVQHRFEYTAVGTMRVPTENLSSVSRVRHRTATQEISTRALRGRAAT